MRTRQDLIQAATDAGLSLDQIEIVPMPGGAPGESTIASRMSFEDPWAAARLLQILADEDASDPVVRAWSLEILKATAEEMGEDDAGSTLSPELKDAFAEALWANVQAHIRFVHEPEETFQSARVTMSVGAGDCDDHARLLYSLALAGGVPADLLFYTEDDAQPVHVVTKLKDSTGWVWAETTIDAEYGEEPFAALGRLQPDDASNPLSHAGAQGIGTVLGAPSLAELKDLIATKDYEIAQLDQAWGNLSPSWVTRDPAAYVDFTNDWNELKTRYAEARARAETVISLAVFNVLLPENAQAAGASWDGVLAAVSPVPNTVTKGSLHDLYSRLGAAGGVVDLSHYPPLTPGNDLDMQVLSTLNRVPAILGGGNTTGFFGSGIPTWAVLSAAGLGVLVLIGPTLARASTVRVIRGRS